MFIYNKYVIVIAPVVEVVMEVVAGVLMNMASCNEAQ